LLYYKSMRRIIVALAILLPVILVVGILFWYFAFYQKPASEQDHKTTAKPSPGVGFGNLSPYAKLCTNFQKVKYEISCEKAVSLALEKAQGEVQKVSIGPVQAVDRESTPPKLVSVDNWLIDIKLQQPYFDEALEKDVKILRIGIGLHQHLGFYKQVLE